MIPKSRRITPDASGRYKPDEVITNSNVGESAPPIIPTVCSLIGSVAEIIPVTKEVSISIPLRKKIQDNFFSFIFYSYGK